MNIPSDLRRLPPPAMRMRPPPVSAINPNLRVLPLVILIYSFLLLPIEVKFVAGGLNLYAFRIGILIALPLLIYLAPRRTGQFSKVDWLVTAGCIWMMVSFVQLYGPSDGLIRSVALVLDTFGGYLIARGSISSLNDLRRVLILIIPGLLFAAAFFMIESISDRLMIRPFFSSIFGNAVNYEGGSARGNLNLLYERRLGLRRAYSVFSYPILGGVILASLLPLFLMSGLKSKALYAGVVASFAAFFSLSSATFLALAMGVGLVVSDRFLPLFRPLRWPLLSAVLVFYAVLAEIALKSGIVGVVSRFTLNPATAYIRRMQWKYGGETVMENPWVGIGFGQYNRPEWLTGAIDAHFLALALRFGLIPPILFAIAIAIVMVSIGRVASRLPKGERDLLVGVNIMMAILIFSAMTVTYFSEANVFFMIALGIATSCMLAVSGQTKRGPIPVSGGLGNRYMPAPGMATSSQKRTGP
ncbi:MAG: hypothetical protein ABJK59_14470 [Erythrobacter sp.]|uniref:O-antigen ligase family protein n=1 Tax=Erythrobacter sp. TaxID=1042 RepID=UPI003299FC0F